MSTEITPALRMPRFEAPARATGPRDAARAAAPRGEVGGVRRTDLDAAVRQAATRLFDDRTVDVRGFHDPVTDRLVYRVVDSRNGEVLFQNPPDQLLRFYAMSRGIDDPLLRVDV